MEREGVEPYWIAMQVVKLGDGIVVTNRDVTEERARQHQIANLNEFTQSMIENAPFSIIATDPAGTVTAMNPAAESLTFYRKHELIGQHSMVMLHDPAEMSARAVQLSKDLSQPVAGGLQLADREAQAGPDRRARVDLRPQGRVAHLGEPGDDRAEVRRARRSPATWALRSTSPSARS